jgi:hypothetical protein
VTLTVEDQADAWLVRVPKLGGLVCEITVPRERFEWFASVKRLPGNEEVWSDWMDHYDMPEEDLAAEMAECIAQFVERVLGGELRLPLRIYEEKT